MNLKTINIKTKNMMKAFIIVLVAMMVGTALAGLAVNYMGKKLDKRDDENIEDHAV